MNSRIKIIGVAIALGLVLVIASLLIKPPISQPLPFPMDTAEKLSVEQLADKARGVSTRVVLPTWMPGQIKLREIYFEGLAILVYSEQDVRDYRDDDVTIEISRTDFSPTPEQLKQTSGEVLEIGDFSVVMLENAQPGPEHEERGIKPIIVYFWNDGFYYIITANKDETTREDMITIVENMKPVGPETLRKCVPLSE